MNDDDPTDARDPGHRSKIKVKKMHMRIEMYDVRVKEDDKSRMKKHEEGDGLYLRACEGDPAWRGRRPKATW